MHIISKNATIIFLNIIFLLKEIHISWDARACVPDAPGAQEQIPLSGNTRHKNIRDQPSEKEKQNC